MADISHFAINADDSPGTRAFYERVFGWRFEPWGPPGFFKIVTSGESGVQGAFQDRRELVPGKPVGIEVTIGVDDVDAVAATAVEAGGRVVMERATIPGVGHLVFVEDPSGNVIGAMQYERGKRP